MTVPAGRAGDSLAVEVSICAEGALTDLWTTAFDIPIRKGGGGGSGLLDGGMMELAARPPLGRGLSRQGTGLSGKSLAARSETSVGGSSSSDSHGHGSCRNAPGRWDVMISYVQRDGHAAKLAEWLA